ncbi:hypothetical protein DU508_16255 [Pedobacter chinensis]|uniref:Uncharacterized protein n=1 Tax=Pedobacter chinensis TaxID=2282421 RepID=A0A369PTC1_9SPHI|nr:hypothetical protein DU508_16255 [Pedobacter chinensis]
MRKYLLKPLQMPTKNQVGSILDERESYLKQIQDLNKKLKRPGIYCWDNDIDTVDFRAIKNECGGKISILESRLTELTQE